MEDVEEIEIQIFGSELGAGTGKGEERRGESEQRVGR